MSNSFFPVVKNRNFLKLWSSQILSQMTIHLVNFMLISRIFEKTGSSVAVSMLWISYALPAIFLLPISGPLVDIMNRKRILLFTNILQAVTVLSFLVVNDHIYSVLPIVFIYSALNQFYIPAEAASIPDLVPKNFLPAANSLFLLTSQLMFVIGFGAGGSLISLLGHKIPFLLSSLMLTLAAVAVWTLPESAKRKTSFGSSLVDFWSEFYRGYEYLRSEPKVFFPLGVLIGGGLLLYVMSAIFPLIGKEILGIGIKHTGVAIIVPVGIGALIASTIVPRLAMKKRNRWLVENGMLILSLSLVFLGIILPVAGGYFSYVLGLRVLLGIPAIMAIGFCAIMVYVPSQTVVQQRTPENMRGRILSASSFLITAFSIVPLIFGAAITDMMGIRTMLVLIAVCVLIARNFSRKSGDGYMLNSKM